MAPGIALNGGNLPSPQPSPTQARLGELATPKCPYPRADTDGRVNPLAAIVRVSHLPEGEGQDEGNELQYYWVKAPVMPEYQLPELSFFGGVAAACWLGCWTVAVHCVRAGASPGTGSGAPGAGIASLGLSGVSGD
jgi:hypothetical protein